MGRYYYDKKTSADDCDDLDVFWLNRHGYFCGIKSGGIKWTNNWGREAGVGFTVDVLYSSHIKFSYTHTDGQTRDKTEMEYKADLTSTPCHYGGKRWWFKCPLVINGKYCGRRVGKLYLGGKYFGCRHCYNLTYDSRNLSISNAWWPSARALILDNQMSKLYPKIGRHYYAGKPTRKRRKYDKMAKEIRKLALYT